MLPHLATHLRDLEWKNVSYGWHSIWRTNLGIWYLFLGNVYDENGLYDSIGYHQSDLAIMDNYVQLVWLTSLERNALPIVEKGIELMQAKEMELGELLDYLGVASNGVYRNET